MDGEYLRWSGRTDADVSVLINTHTLCKRGCSCVRLRGEAEVSIRTRNSVGCNRCRDGRIDCSVRICRIHRSAEGYFVSCAHGAGVGLQAKIRIELTKRRGGARTCDMENRFWRGGADADLPILIDAHTLNVIGIDCRKSATIYRVETYLTSTSCI